MTIYVRKEEEKVYNALMLENLTLKDLKEAVSIFELAVYLVKLLHTNNPVRNIA